MQTILNLCKGDPLVAIKACIDGLLTYHSNPYFKFNPRSFGRLESYFGSKFICVGCVASLALMEITNIKDNRLVESNYGNSYERSNIYNISYDDLNEFESAIDELRTGNVHNLNEYFGSNLPDLKDVFINNDDKEEILYYTLNLIRYYNSNPATAYVIPKDCLPEYKDKLLKALEPND